MNFTLYIERQKQIIRTRHEGETFLIPCVRIAESIGHWRSSYFDISLLGNL